MTYNISSSKNTPAIISTLSAKNNGGGSGTLGYFQQNSKQHDEKQEEYFDEFYKSEEFDKFEKNLEINNTPTTSTKEFISYADKVKKFLNKLNLL